MDFPQKSAYTFDDLRQLVACLRAPDGCPWDREQTHGSIRRDFIEETYEAVEAIDRDDPALLCEELGDVLFQVAFHTRIEEERGRFTMEDVLTGIIRKMLIRHPHVFGETEVSSTGEVLRNWESIKNAVKGVWSKTETLRLVPETFPALMRADKLLKRADQAGADGTAAVAASLPGVYEDFLAAGSGAEGGKGPREAPNGRHRRRQRKGAGRRDVAPRRLQGPHRGFCESGGRFPRNPRNAV